jgi:hypothetical protein
MSPITAAEQIVKGVKRSRQRVLITRDAWWMDLLKRIFPSWGNRVAVQGLVKVLRMGPLIQSSIHRHQSKDPDQTSTAS